MVRVRVVGHVERDDIRGREEFLERDIREVELVSEFLVREGVKPEYLHIKSLRDADNVSTDVSGADHAERFPSEVKAAQPREREGARLAHALVGVNDTSREREDEREGELGDRILAVEGDVRHGDAPSYRFSGINVVK